MTRMTDVPINPPGCTCPHYLIACDYHCPQHGVEALLAASRVAEQHQDQT